MMTRAKRTLSLLLCLPLLLTAVPFTVAEAAAPRRVAITVDDGPDGSGCEAYLSICREFGIHLTFFVVGRNISGRETQLRDMLDAGCEIGNHSWSHSYLNELTAKAVAEEISRTNEAIVKAAPEAEVCFVRAPYFAYSDVLCENVGFPLIDASRYESDADKGKETLATLLAVEDGDIVLLHCWNSGSIQALRDAVPSLLSEGVEFVTVSELMASQGVAPVSGLVYRQVKKNLTALYTAAETIFSGGPLTDGGWENWQTAAVLPLEKVKSLQPGEALLVRYTSVNAPWLILQSWSGGPGWIQLEATSSDGQIALFTYEDMTAAFGELKTLNACQLRPVGADITIESVMLARKE